MRISLNGTEIEVRKSKDEILNYVYRKYPEYGKYSMIRDKVLGRLHE